MKLESSISFLAQILSQAANLYISPRDLGLFPIHDLDSSIRNEFDQAVDELHKRWLRQFTVSIDLVLQRARIELHGLAKRARETLNTLDSNGIEFIPYQSAEYPLLLREISDPPIGLFLKGNRNAFQEPVVGIIGSRKASKLGLLEAYNLASRIAISGLGVASGGAFGCDTAAHRGVIDSSAKRRCAIIFQAGGLTKLYPRSNQSLFDDVLDCGGALVSEKLPYHCPRPYDFPIRNRLISGVSTSLFVAHAGSPSGALTTARAAADQSRSVYVLSHPNFDIRAEGSRGLIRDGAKSITNSSQFPIISNNCIILEAAKPTF